MKLHARKVRRTAGAFAVTAAAAGLVLTGCGKSTGSGSAAPGAGAAKSSSLNFARVFVKYWPNDGVSGPFR